jgi:RNA polymerase sigma-70 factor (ECF subfamily)
LDPVPEPIAETLTDGQIVMRVRAGEVALFEHVMRRYNQRVYRAVRSIVSSNEEAEDVMQEAYVKAYANLGGFEFRAQLSTWLVKIAVHEAFARNRRARRFESLDDTEPEEHAMTSPVRSPEQRSSDRELSGFLEEAILDLPEAFRSVFLLRAVEELSAAETADILDIPEETVKTRLHRAKSRLQSNLLDRVGTSLPSVFGFHAIRCDRVVFHVLERIGK